MKITPFYAVLLLLLAVAAGSLGAIVTNRWLAQEDASRGMHDFVHKELRLTSAQEVRLDALERDFAVERRKLDLALRSANAGLAQAMSEEHRYGPKVGAAIDQVHIRMGDLQKATIRHVFDMRGLLEANQQAAFDREVNKALTSDPKS